MKARRRRGWGWWVRRGVVLLIVGAVVNVVVAWGIAWKAQRSHGGQMHLPLDVGARAPFGAPEGWARPSGMILQEELGYRELGWSSFSPEDAGNASSSRPDELWGPFRWDRCVVEYRAGWPLRSMHGCYGGPGTWGGVGTTYWWMLDMTKRQRKPPYVRWLPLRPMVLGFAVNTVFWGGVALGAWVGAGACWGRLLRGRTRRRRGLCDGCGYDLAGLSGDVCPECGRGGEGR